jgi:hypothetical protein
MKEFMHHSPVPLDRDGRRARGVTPQLHRQLLQNLPGFSEFRAALQRL